MKPLDIYTYHILDLVKEALLGIDKNNKIILVNKHAEELLNIKKEISVGKKVSEIIDDIELIEFIKNKDFNLDKELEINNNHLSVNKVPIKKENSIYGMLILFNDITDYNKISKRLNEDENYIEILNTILDTANEWVVVVDETGIIKMMSKAYKEFLGEHNAEGKHVTDVIENTRMHIVVRTGVKEIGDIQENAGNKMISMRVPIVKKGKIVGAVGKVMFKDIGDFVSLRKKIDRLEEELEYYKSELKKERTAKYSFEDCIGNSPKMKFVIDIAKRVAKTNSNVLILGESGTGKELLAHAIHNASDRKYAPFIKLNCAAIPADLLESELFGYEEGAFSGAKKGGKEGKFELANGGTILLDEIGDMPLEMQAKLLRVLQEKEFEHVGGNIIKKSDVRIIASTNKNLERLVSEGEFREDLYYRLNVVNITIPPLRERREDIKDIAIALKNKIAKNIGIYAEGISKEVFQYFESYYWPGNIRELENVIERAINLLDSNLVIRPEHLPNKITKRKSKNYMIDERKLKTILEETERKVITEVLNKNEGNKRKTADLLGITRASLYKKLDKYGIS
ncbi:sigma 54-interacting transcriptional regulator [Sporosalibacterium faouarense]|uniref:sigma 54-interacting transcriptional regulator n=1 Tax=Sporosalibacterium faouarense TaxID=516123 RepID=UPI00192AD38F|nr:sigma 54-interacting transcriptional regulator [Sporosalibacterium faouarense]